MQNGHFGACVAVGDANACWCEFKRYALAFIISIAIVIIEILGSKITGSLSLLSDAFHALTDGGGHCISMLAILLVKRRPKKEKSVRSWGAIVIGILIGASALWIVIEAVGRFVAPIAIDGITMNAVAFIGIVGNVIQYRILSAVASDEHTVTHRAVYRHVKSDLLQSVAIIVAGTCILLTGWTIVDTALSFIIAIILFRWAFHTVQDARSSA